MGCCQNRLLLEYQKNELQKYKAKRNKIKLEPLCISVIGDSEGLDMMDDLLKIKQTSLKETQSQINQKMPSESVIIDLRSGTSLASPQREKSSKNLNQRFLQML
ncbi:unnamed protein product [Paramecium sonneborni]|uniref:Uncharacterized protein n=1 Tax=Paramecium sonneborni TaxID=65129 RepID=A0A8S1PZT1_9CILI|nr:unnamed protein product [Paramecium sonneborni]